MPYLIHTHNSLTGWRDACNCIIANGDGFNLILHIERPLHFMDWHLAEITGSDIISKRTLEDVINTIFPSKLHERNPNLTNEQFYSFHEQLYNRGRTMHYRNRGLWGNYFLRFTRFGNSNKNQLQKIIDDINSRTNQYAACYIMHVSSADTDSNTRNIGNPCLQYIQFGQEGNTINMTAVYRNHDFFTKALGNYIGLSKLLRFVCQQTNRNMGTFTCHSIHYFLDQKRNVQNAINNLTW